MSLALKNDASITRIPLVKAIEYAFDASPKKITTCGKLSIISGKTGVAAICCIGASTFIGVAKAYAKDNYALFLACSTASVITYTALDTWAYYKWLDTSNSPQLKIQFNEETKCKKCAFLATKLTSLAIGVIAQLALAYVAYTDNDKNLTDFFLLLAAASGISASSLLSSFMKIPRRRCLDKIEQKLISCQQDLGVFLSKRTFHFFSLPKEKQLALLEKLSDKQTFQNPEELKNIVRSMFISTTQPLSKRCTARKGGEYVATSVGLISATARLSFFGAVAYSAGSLFSSDYATIAGSVASALVVASTTYISVDVLTGMAQRTYHSTLNLFQKKQAPTLERALHPHINIVKHLPNSTLAVLTLLPMLPLVDTYLPQLGIVEKVAFAVGTFLLYTKALNALADELLTMPVLTNEEGKQIIRFYNGFKSFEDTFKKSSLLNIALFTQILPEEIFTEVIKPLDLSKEQIEDYLRSSQFTQSIDLEMNEESESLLNEDYD